MSRNVRSLVRTIAKQLRYETLDRLIGVRVSMGEPMDLSRSITGAVNQAMPDLDLRDLSEPQVVYQHRVYAKYGFLDIELIEGRRSITLVPVASIAILQELGVVRHSRNQAIPSPDDPLDWDATFLEQLIEEINQSRLYVKLILEIPDRQRFTRQFPLGRRPNKEDFPDAFVITDASLTNAQSTWLNRHFYW